MSAVAAAIGGAAVLGFVGSKMASDAAGSAADKQTQAAEYASDLQNSQFEQTRTDQAPYRQAGYGALSQMGDPSFQHDFGAADFQADPGYQFRMQQGMDAIQRSAAARGGLQSGGTLKSLNDYAQGEASTEYQNAYNRFTNNQTNRFNRLASLAGLGQTANGITAQAGENTANAVGGYMTGAANAQGAAGIASANAYGGAMNGVGNNLMTLGMMNKFAPQQAPNYGGGYSGNGPMGGITPATGASDLSGMGSIA